MSKVVAAKSRVISAGRGPLALAERRTEAAAASSEAAADTTTQLVTQFTQFI
jgi:hypothetical protein